MTNNINWASSGVKAGFTGYQIPVTAFAHDINFTPQEQKVLLSDLADRGGIDGLFFEDDKPFSYSFQNSNDANALPFTYSLEEGNEANILPSSLPNNVPNIKSDIEVASLKEDMKNVAPLTEPPKMDNTKEVILNGALVFLGVIVLVKLLS